MKNIFALFLCLLCINTYAENTSTWSCLNPWVEISCHAEHCQFETEYFTPFRINIKNQKDINICAYSGCWSGQVSHQQHSTLSSYTTQQLQWNYNQQTSEKFIVNIDTENKIGVLLGYSYALPLQCQMD
ncbi:hypothetical protein HX122_03435 [Acinetobacter towneri]|uniref:hypothetical protein n=1 Tax=Acinetobacter towneri TaxID=202956 RepID=UPI0025754DE6|nr:hypothetical protein [Acinetobacter towneri]MDM1754055.1 hypothetical protein [Acinetobacter towneri]